MNYRMPFLAACVAALAALVLVPEPAHALSMQDLLAPKVPEPVAAVDTQKARQAVFLKKIRRSDPDKKTIERAIFNGSNELGIVLSRTVPMKAVPPLTKSMLSKLAKQFPGQDLTVITYAPTSPPMKVGTGRLKASTRDMTYEAAR